MLELLAPAGSPEAVTAAVQNGADAVYMGFGSFNARQNAKNFTKEELSSSIKYCHIRGAKVYVTLNTLVSDRELPDAIALAAEAAECGADAVLVQDLGILRGIKQAIPDLVLHASTQMSIHNSLGANLAYEMGASRVVAARELSAANIASICKNSPAEIEIFCHGALCMCYSGQCYMSAVIGRRSGNRGLCAQPCRLSYSIGAYSERHPLSLKDLSLAEYLQEIDKLGVKCVKIEGRMRRPEYVAIVSRIYSQAIKEGRAPSNSDLELLAAAFSRQGFTDGFFTGRKGPDMLGVREEENRSSDPGFAAVRRGYLNGEAKRVPVRFWALLQAGEPSKFAVRDDLGHLITQYGPTPAAAMQKELDPVALQTQLFKTGGTPYYCTSAKVQVDPHLYLPISDINEMRRNLLLELSVLRREATPVRIEKYIPEPRLRNSRTEPQLTISVTRLSQLSPELAELAPAIVYVPLDEAASSIRSLSVFLRSQHTEVIVSLPPIIHDNELPEVLKQLALVKRHGIVRALVNNLGHITLVRKAGFEARGDYGLNIWNSASLRQLHELGLSSATLSFELRLAQIKDISKCMDTELIVYGRLPLMVTENCAMKNVSGNCICTEQQYLKDRRGAMFPLLKTWGCRNTIYNSKKLFLADNSSDYRSLGLWGIRLMFTTENAYECTEVTRRYLGLGNYSPGEITRGLYYRGVE